MWIGAKSLQNWLKINTSAGIPAIAGKLTSLRSVGEIKLIAFCKQRANYTPFKDRYRSMWEEQINKDDNIKEGNIRLKVTPQCTIAVYKFSTWHFSHMSPMRALVIDFDQALLIFKKKKQTNIIWSKHPHNFVSTILVPLSHTYTQVSHFQYNYKATTWIV